MRITSMVLACLLLAAPAAAHTVTTTDGTKYEGEVLLQNDEHVVILTSFDGKKTIPRAEVKSVNTSVPPLRKQFEFRFDRDVADAKKLWSLYGWAKKKGFPDPDLQPLLKRIVQLDGEHKKARKLLGHELVDGRWMTPAEKKQHELEAQAAEMRAKGLVLYEGAWVTPEERDAREKGLKKDGDDWVTEEEWHKRRGEKLVDGEWVRVGEAEGKALQQKARLGSRVPLGYQWSAHFDALFTTNPATTKRVIDGAEKAFGVMRRILKPTEGDFPEDGSARVALCLFNKMPNYVRFTKQWFAKEMGTDAIVPGWSNAIQRQHAWWWTQDRLAVGCYQFPNTDKTFISNVVHHLGHVLLTRYKLNYRFPSHWLLEGFSYYLEMEALGYSLSFSLGRGGGSVATGGDSKPPAWAESDQWRSALKRAVAEGQDPPIRRMAKMPAGQFRYIELVKSWSVIESLIRWDPAKFKQFIDGTKNREQSEEDALRAAFGVDYRRLDQKWRKYVANGFRHVK